MDKKEIFSHYEHIRHEEQEALDRRKSIARSISTEFVRIENERNTITDMLRNAVLSGSDLAAASRQAEEALTLLNREEQRLLAQFDLPEDYLTLHVRCALCSDTGYTGEINRIQCVCLTKAILENKRYTSHVNERETFKRFDENVYPSEAQLAEMKRFFDIAEEYANNFPNSRFRNLVLMGTPGLGKSFLINAIADRILERGHSIEKVTAYNLIENLLKGIRANFDGAEPYIGTPVLFIDDLGTEPLLNNLTRDFLFSILNERRNANRHTVTATNLSITTLQQRYGERIFSRLISEGDTGILKLTGDNLRLSAAWSNI